MTGDSRGEADFEPKVSLDHLRHGTGLFFFFRRGPTLSGVVDYRRHHLSHGHYLQTFIGFKI